MTGEAEVRRAGRGARGARMNNPITPLVVDLDDTLVRTDTLLEQLVAIVFRYPLRLLPLILALFRGRAGFKRIVAGHEPLDCSSLPYDEAVLALMRSRKDAGAELHLVTAADQSIAEGVSAHLGLFDSCQGSDGRSNVKGPAKAQALAERFPAGFAYVGDCGADVPVWRAAREVIVAGASPGFRRRLEREGLKPDQLLARRPASPRDWIKALRIHQWAKNLVILVPMFLAQKFDDPTVIVRGLLGWMCFNLVASGTYLINDLSDLAADRQHLTKRRRALAAGLIHIRLAAPLALVLLFGGLGGAWAVNAGFGLATLAYVALTLSYSFRLKAAPLIDVMTIGGLFTVRIIAGMILFDTVISLWLGTFAFMLFTSLALAKRHGELFRALQQNTAVARRGYLPGDVALTAPLGISTGVTSVLVMILYLALEAEKSGLYSRVQPLYLIPAILALWILRIWFRAHRGVLHEDPVVFALRDRVSWLHALAIALLWAASILPMSS